MDFLVSYLLSEKGAGATSQGQGVMRTGFRLLSELAKEQLQRDMIFILWLILNYKDIIKMTRS